MSTATQSLAAAATSARQATEKSVQALTDGATTITEQMNQLTGLPIDLTEPVARYFDYLQKAVDLTRGVAGNWAALVTTLTSTVWEQARSVADAATEQTRKIAEITVEQAEKVEQATVEQAEKVESAEKEQARLARQAERQHAKLAHQQARAPYEELTKTELVDHLERRGLPKSGTVEELIERLVSADAQ